MRRIDFLKALALLGTSPSVAQVIYKRRTSGGGAAIAYDTGSQGEQTSGASLVVSHTVATDANCLIVFIATYLSGGGQTFTATYNGDAMTSAGNVTNGSDKFQLFYLLNPDTGTHDIEITPSDSSTEIALVAGSFKNVASVDNFTTDSGASYPFDITVPANTGSWAAAGLGCYNKTVATVTTGVERVTNENGSAQNSCWLFTKQDSGLIDGELDGSVDWRFLGVRLNT